MTTETVPATLLTDEQIKCIALATPDRDLLEVVPFARAVESAVLQSPEIQALRDLLKEARQHLPMAAQFWNEDDEPERGSRNVKRVMELIGKIDAAMEKQS